MANVVLNRVMHPSYPDTVEGVILEPKQFCPVRTGSIHQVVADDEARAAVADALAGKRSVSKGALFFYNPEETSRGSWVRSRPPEADIGNHRFAL